MNETQFHDLHDDIRTLIDQHKISVVEIQKKAEQFVSGAIIELLQTDRLFGEVLIQIPRHYNTKLNGAMGVGWIDGQLELVINPVQLIIDINYWHELLVLLKHEVLHVVWQHPLRYQNNQRQNNVTLATDVAVNQYLDEAPHGTGTLTQLEQLLGKKLPEKEDSATYLQIIQTSKISGKKNKQNENKLLDTEQKFDSKNQSINQSSVKKLDVHDGWNDQSQEDLMTQKTSQLKTILTQAWRATPDRDRGLLPGKLKQQLEQVDQIHLFNWKQLIKQKIGNLPQGKRSAYSRFNRRQPVRMDLPGKITNLVTRINIFVDNSGSMSDKEISFLLSQIQEIVKVTETQTTVFSFDAVVHEHESYKLDNQSAVQFKRIGGGGTSFQSIFTYLKANHYTNNDTLVIVLTDGWGEKLINNYHFNNVVWVLTTPVNEFSVKNRIGKITTVAGDADYKKVVGIK
ncbi:DUF2201 family putative metallopeptidase [Paucilactobacillus kaifaensis]|uniref:vWA domain-containing protein n=1 Tax=Paucilactobacillus kaifaensis TaxID=2559921 RepID=UPI0010F9F003|nr:VWA-like domain-containing protein [Paucilactobacillus kaifaensis]